MPKKHDKYKIFCELDLTAAQKIVRIPSTRRASSLLQRVKENESSSSRTCRIQEMNEVEG